MNNLYIINLACASDDNFAQHMTAMLCSCLSNLSATYALHVYILDGGICPENRQKIQDLFDIYKNSQVFFLSIDSVNYKDYSISQAITTPSYFRIDLPDLLPDLDKVIYLDSDIIVLGDISEIWSIDMDTNLIVATQDPSKGMEIDYNNAYNKKTESGYFNAGVLIMNLKGMRQENSTKAIKLFIEKQGKSNGTLDQLALNFCFFDRWKKLTAQWNFGSALEICGNYSDTALSESDFLEAKKRPCLIHFTSRFFKPWLYESVGNHKNDYYKFLDKTSYSGWRPRFSPRSLLYRLAYTIYFIHLSEKNRQFIYDHCFFLRQK